MKAPVKKRARRPEAKEPAKIHELKTMPEFFQHLWEGRKKFEIRKDDRGFRAGDTLRLQEYLLSDQKYTKRWMEAKVNRIWKRLPGVDSQFVVMDIEVFAKRGGA